MADLRKGNDLSPIHGNEIVAVTGARTLYWGQEYVCTGTSADYTLTLQTAIGHKGERMLIRMGSSTALTKLVTLDANSTETINEALTRIMWHDEVALIESNGANIVKVGGLSIPMTATMARVTDQSFSASTFTQILLTAQTDGLPQMWDAANNRGVIVRPNRYNAFFSAYVSGLSVGGYLAVGVNAVVTSGAVVSQFNAQAGALQGVAQFEKAGRSLVAGDFLVGSAYGDNAPTCAASVVPATLSIIEVPTW